MNNKKADRLISLLYLGMNAHINRKLCIQLSATYRTRLYFPDNKGIKMSMLLWAIGYILIFFKIVFLNL